MRLDAAIPVPLPMEMLSRAASRLLAALDSISVEDFRRFQHWERCWDCCIQSQGDYFEGDQSFKLVQIRLNFFLTIPGNYLHSTEHTTWLIWYNETTRVVCANVLYFPNNPRTLLLQCPSCIHHQDMKGPLRTIVLCAKGLWQLCAWSLKFPRTSKFNEFSPPSDNGIPESPSSD